jgi:uncharacterized protein (DUF2141 family)
MNTLILGLFISLFSLSSNFNNPKLEIQITEAKSDKGMIRILIFSKANGFPDEPETALKSYSIPPKNKACTLSINDLAPGTYAVSVIHDEDGNGKLSFNMVGYPSEKFGFSNNPKVYFSAPSFDKAAFELKSENKQVQIILR